MSLDLILIEYLVSRLLHFSWELQIYHFWQTGKKKLKFIFLVIKLKQKSDRIKYIWYMNLVFFFNSKVNSEFFFSIWWLNLISKNNDDNQDV